LTGRYGYPVAEQTAIPGGFSQRFENGTLTCKNGGWV
jgi:hypothetical protein